MNDLNLYGWNDWLFQQKEASDYSDFIHGRIAVTHKTCYEVVAEAGCYTCELTGNMLYGKEDSELPCTGDWVIFQLLDDSKGLILDRLPRRKTLYRLKSGTVAEKQAIAAHVEQAFIVQSLDLNFNVRRIERTMLQVVAEEIRPVLILTKTDLGFEEAEVKAALKHLENKLPVCYTSIHDPASIAELRSYIGRGETVVFIGSSGVGKSSLINQLCQKEVLQTGAISGSTGKGKHTSTRREMILLDDAGVLIDTPGIKVFGVTSDDQDKLSEVLDLSRFEGACRFADCQHVNEKGCAVIKAVNDGEIEEGVYENYLKLRKEAWHYTSSVHEKRKREKSFSKMVKQVKKKPF